LGIDARTALPVLLPWFAPAAWRRVLFRVIPLYDVPLALLHFLRHDFSTLLGAGCWSALVWSRPLAARPLPGRAKSAPLDVSFTASGRHSGVEVKLHGILRVTQRRCNQLVRA